MAATMSRSDTGRTLKRDPSPWVHAVSGQVAGMVGLTVIHPIDTVKCRMQATGAAGARTSALGITKDIIFREGVSGIYKGIGAPLVAFGAINAINFAVHNHALRSMQDLQVLGSRSPGTGEWQASVTGNFLAGAAAGVASSFVRGPAERIKTVQQACTTGRYHGTLHCARELLRMHGFVGGWFTGIGSTVLREVPQMGLYFVTYDAVKKAFLERAGENNATAATVLAGGSAGVLQWVATYPLDVIKTRIQAAPPDAYKGVWDCAASSIRAEGPSVMFRGLGIAVVRAFPLHAAIFLTCETVRDVLGKLESPQGLVFQAHHVPSTAPEPPAHDSSYEPLPSSYKTSSPGIQLASTEHRTPR